MAIRPHGVFADMPGAFTDALGDPVMVSPGGAAARCVRAVVRAPAGQPAGPVGKSAPGVIARMITASFAELDVPGLRDGDITVIGGVTFRVREPMPDGRGMVRCELERSV